MQQVENAVIACNDPRRHKDRLTEILSKDGWALRYCLPGWTTDRDITIAAVKNYGMALEDAPYEHCDDKVVVAWAVRNNGMALMYATDKLKEEKDLVKKAVTQYGPALEFAHPRLREDPEIVLTAVESAGSALMFARELRKQKEFCLQALKVNSKCCEYIEETLRQDPEIVKAAGDGSKIQRRKRCSRSELRRRLCSPVPPRKSPSALVANSKWPA